MSHPSAPLRRPDDPAVFVDEFASGEFADLGDGVDHADGDVRGRLLDRGGRLAAKRLAIVAAHFLDEDRLGGGAAAVGRQDHVQLIGIHQSAFCESGGGSAFGWPGLD